ncbi:10495_t:CDS:2, partial [Racocetra fulgida]
MTSTIHEDVVSRLQKFFEVPNGGVVDDPPINVSGKPFKIAPVVAVRPGTAFVPRPVFSTVVPPPPGDVDVAVGPNVGYLRQKCLTWMREQYVRAVVSMKILEPRPGIREPTTGMATQRWDFGNVKKHSKDPIRDPAPCNAPNLAHFQINIPVGEVFWDPPAFPTPRGYAPAIPPVVAANNFTIDLYRIQRVALKAE